MITDNSYRSKAYNQLHLLRYFGYTAFTILFKRQHKRNRKQVSQKKKYFVLH